MVFSLAAGPSRHLLARTVVQTQSQCGVSEITIHSLRSNWPGARREGGSVSTAILGRLSNEAPGQFQRNPKGCLAFGRRCCCSLLTDPLRDMLWCPCGSTSRLASAQNPLSRMYGYFGDTTLAEKAKYWQWVCMIRTQFQIAFKSTL